MKKLLLMMAFIVVSTSVFCQGTETVNYAQVGTWSKTKDDWIWTDIQEVSLVITFNKSVVSINNELGSRFETIEVINKQKNYTTWKALDEEYITCHLTMKFEDGYSVLIIVYDDLCFRYFY